MTEDADPAPDVYEDDPPATGLDAEAVARAEEIGNAIQHAVSGTPDLAVSVVGIALDQLSGMLIRSPDALLDSVGWLRLATDVYNYVVTGETTEALDRLRIDGDLGL